MAKTLYVPVNNLSSEVKKILVPVGGVSKYAVKGYCSVGGLSKQFFGAGTPPTPVPTYIIVPEYSYVAGSAYQVHNLLTPQVTLDASYQYFNEVYSSSLSSVAYMKEHWTEIRSAILSYISSFNTVYLSFYISKKTNQISISINLGQNSYPKTTVIDSKSSTRYGDLWRRNPTGSENIETTYFYNVTVTGSSYTIDTPIPFTAVMSEIGLYGAVSDNVNVSDIIAISNYGMKEADN